VVKPGLDVYLQLVIRRHSSKGYFVPSLIAIMRTTKRGTRTAASNPTGPTEYMGSYTLVKHIPMSEVVKEGNICQLS
jgi:hypothetical protein